MYNESLPFTPIGANPVAVATFETAVLTVEQPSQYQIKISLLNIKYREFPWEPAPAQVRFYVGTTPQNVNQELEVVEIVDYIEGYGKAEYVWEGARDGVQYYFTAAVLYNRA